MDKYLTRPYRSRARGRYDPHESQAQGPRCTQPRRWTVAIPLLMVALVGPSSRSTAGRITFPVLFSPTTPSSSAYPAITARRPARATAPRPACRRSPRSSAAAWPRAGGAAVPGVAPARLVPAVSDRSDDDVCRRQQPRACDEHRRPTSGVPAAPPGFRASRPCSGDAHPRGLRRGRTGRGRPEQRRQRWLPAAVRTSAPRAPAAASAGAATAVRRPRHDGRSRVTRPPSVQVTAESAPRPSSDGRWGRADGPRHSGRRRAAASAATPALVHQRLAVKQ